jgi:SusD/RagB-like outer membrane lipoprotein
MKSIKIILIACLMTGAFSSCKKQLLDINTDPNNPTTASASPDLVLSNALNTSANIYNNSTNGNNNFVWAGLWLGHISYSGNYAIATENISYNLTNSFAAGTWDALYDNNEDYDFVQRKGEETGNNFYRAIGMLMKAYNFQTLVDLYNNVAYSDALQGTAVSKPKYDAGKDVYADLAKKMDTAIALLKQSGNTTIKGDIMFGSDATKWTQFANTVKLRLLLRQSEVNAADAKTQAGALSGGFLTVNATVNPGYLNSTGKMNPFWGSNVSTAGTYQQTLYRAGQYAIDVMKNNKDTFRLRRFYTPIGGITDTSLSKYAGNYFGDQGVPNSQTSQIGAGVLKNYNQPAIIMLAAESYFLQAEAALRGWITGDPKTLFESGVEASFAYLGLPKARAQEYYSQAGNNQTTWAAATNFQEQLALIIRQKWVAETWINEFESDVDYRRLHLPADIPLSTSPYSTGIFPARLLYPQREINVNGENVAAQGTITPGTKVWWMK